MSAGGVWTAGSDSDSAARLNQKTITIDTAANLAALSTTYPGQLIYCTDGTGGAFAVNTMYQRNAANNTWTAQLPMTTHDHTTAAATTGGLYSDILGGNTGQLVYLNYPSPRVANFVTSFTGTTPIDDMAANQWRVKMDTLAVASNYAQCDMGGIRIDFGSNIKFQAKIEHAGATTGLQARIGVNNEKSNANVDGTTKSIGFEFCDSTGTVYQLASSDGLGGRTASPTGQPFTGVHGIKFLYTRSTNIIGTIDQTIATTKSSNLPNSGASLADRTMRFGIMTQPPNATVSKQLYLHGAVLVAVDNDVGWN